MVREGKIEVRKKDKLEKIYMREKREIDELDEEENE